MSLHVTSMVIDGNKKAGTLVELHDLAKISHLVSGGAKASSFQLLPLSRGQVTLCHLLLILCPSKCGIYSESFLESMILHIVLFKLDLGFYERNRIPSPKDRCE